MPDANKHTAKAHTAKALAAKAHTAKAHTAIAHTAIAHTAIAHTEDLTFQALRQLQANPRLSQRQLACALGITLGKTNYCLRALIARGLVKAENFPPR